MHTYPVVLTYGKDKDDAIERVTEWVDRQFNAHDQSIYDYGGPVEPDRCEDPEDRCRSATEPQVQENIKARLETEKNIFRENWAKLKAFVEAFKDRDIPPMKFASDDKSETFVVSYKVAVGISHLIESGSEVKERKEPAWMGLYAARKLADLHNCIDSGREDFCIEATLYTIDEESQQAIENGEWTNIWAVLCDFHF
jgi:hypothetical protein